MKTHLRLLLNIILLTSSLTCSAIEKKISFPDVAKTTVVEETGDVLTLRGIALHKHFFQDKYLGAFYSLNSLNNPQQAVKDSGPKRMWLFCISGLDNFKEDWNLAILANNSPEMVKREQINISQFLKLLHPPFHSGDVLVLDYVPNVGTKVVLNGAVRGIIKGNDFYGLILKAWMGRLPPSKKFQYDLFNLS